MKKKRGESNVSGDLPHASAARVLKRAYLELNSAAVGARSLSPEAAEILEGLLDKAAIRYREADLAYRQAEFSTARDLADSALEVARIVDRVAHSAVENTLDIPEPPGLKPTATAEALHKAARRFDDLIP